MGNEGRGKMNTTCIISAKLYDPSPRWMEKFSWFSLYVEMKHMTENGES